MLSSALEKGGVLAKGGEDVPCLSAAQPVPSLPGHRPPRLRNLCEEQEPKAAVLMCSLSGLH